MGGSLKLHWSEWTATKAVGSGTSNEDFMGHMVHVKIHVEASAPKHGHFTILTIRRRNTPELETLHLVRNGWE
jgi:hypothetical protein